MAQSLPNRTLVIGLGESGTEIVRSLKEKVRRSQGNWPVLTYLTIRAREVDVSDPWLSPAEQIVLHGRHLHAFAGSIQELAQSIPPDLLKRLEAEDAEVLHSRLAGHLMYCRARQSVNLALSEMIRRLYDPDIPWSQAVDHKSIGLTTNVYIAMDLEDPIASGCLQDLLETILAHDRWKEGGGRGVWCFVLLTAYGRSEEGKDATFAALDEWSKALERECMQGFRDRVHYFLIELTNERDLPKGEALRTPAYRNRMIRDWLYHIIVEQPSRVGSMQGNLVASRPGARLTLSGLGLTVGIVPYDRINEALALELGAILLESIGDENLDDQSGAKAKQDADVLFAKHLAQDVVIRGDLGGQRLTNDVVGTLPLDQSEQQEVIGKIQCSDYPSSEWLAVIQNYGGELDSRLQGHQDRVHRRVEQDLQPQVRDLIQEHIEGIVRESLYQVLARAKMAVSTLFSQATQVRGRLEKTLVAARAVVDQGRFEKAPDPEEKNWRQQVLENLEPILVTAFITILVLAFLFAATGTAISVWEFLSRQRWLYLMVSVWIGIRILLELIKYVGKCLRAVIVKRTETVVRSEDVQQSLLSFVAFVFALGTVLLILRPFPNEDSVTRNAAFNLLAIFAVLVIAQQALLGLWYVRSGRSRAVPTGLQVVAGVLSTIFLVWLGVWIFGCVAARALLAPAAALDALVEMWSRQRELVWLALAMPAVSLLKLLWDWLFLTRREFNWKRIPAFSFSLVKNENLDVYVPLGLVLAGYALYVGIGMIVAFGYWQQALWAGLVLSAIASAWKQKRFWRRLLEREFIWILSPYLKAYEEEQGNPLTIHGVRTNGGKALRNEVSKDLVFWRLFVLSILVALLTFLFRGRLSGPVPTEGVFEWLLDWLRAAAAGLLGVRGEQMNSTQLTLMVLGAFGVLKHACDYFRGRYRIATLGQNAPSLGYAIGWAASAFAIAAVIGITSVLGVVPGAWLAPTDGQYFFGIAVIVLGLVIAVRYLWEYLNDKALYEWYAEEWLEWEKNYAKARMNVSMLNEAVSFYDRVLDFLRKERERLEAIQARIPSARTNLEKKKADTEASIPLVAEGYSRFLVDIDGAERRGFSWENAKRQDLLAHYVSVTAEGNHHPLEDWLVGRTADLDQEGLMLALRRCTEGRWKRQWERLSAVHFLSPVESPSTEQYERDAFWLFQGESLPYWSYRGDIGGGNLLAAFQLPAIGKEFKPLRDALQGLEHHLGTMVQRDYADDPWTVVCFMVRSGLPMSELDSYRSWETQFGRRRLAAHFYTRVDAMPPETRTTLAQQGLRALDRQEATPVGQGGAAPEETTEPASAADATRLDRARGTLEGTGKSRERTYSRSRGAAPPDRPRGKSVTTADSTRRQRGHAREAQTPDRSQETRVSSVPIATADQLTPVSSEAEIDPWHMLGVSPDASVADIEEAWQARVAALASEGLAPSDLEARLSMLQKARDVALQKRQ